MPFFRRAAAALALTIAIPSLASAQTAACGGDFGSFLSGVQQEALAAGISENAVGRSMARIGNAPDAKVLSRDRSQGVFSQTWAEFAGRMVNASRLRLGKANLQKYASTFARIEAETGVPGPAITAFWGLETDYGAVLGDFNTLAALATLAHDCRIGRAHV